MFDLFLLWKARNDIRQIRRDTAAEWGEDQAVHYIREIDARFEILQSFPESGRTCDEVREGYRKQIVGRHIVFCRIEDDAIVVVRVLHQKRDVRSQP